MGWREHLADTRPLQQPDFRRLWSANIITVIGAQLTVVAVPAQIYAITKSSAYVGLTGMFGLVPLVVLGLYGGALADAMDRRRLLMISDYDGSWESYIDEFAEMILSGLDAIWSSADAYPPDGARDLPAFKRFLRDHQVPSEIFYSGYPEATVLNIVDAL